MPPAAQHKRDAYPDMINLPLLTVAYLAGLLLAQVIPPPTWHLLVPVALATAWLLMRNARGATCLLGCLILAFGYSNYHLQSSPPDTTSLLQSLSVKTPHTFYVRVLQVRSRPDGGKQLDLWIHHVLQNHCPVAVSGGMRLQIEKSQRGFIRGEELAVRTRLRIPRRFGTPGEFNYPRHLSANGLQFTGFLPDDNGIAVLQHTTPSPLAGLRTRIGKLIAYSVPDKDQEALVRALVIGDKDMLNENQRSRLAGMGLSHLFSISGFHFGLVAAFGYLALLAIMRHSEKLLLAIPPRRLAPVLLLPALWCYLQLTGQALPAMRAWLAAAAVAGLLWVRRCCHPVHATLAVALAILVATPMSLFTPSFQLSFAGVFGILVLVPRWSKHVPAMPGICYRITQFSLVIFAKIVVYWTSCNFDYLEPLPNLLKR
jgi:competence protein ComEC